MSVKDREELVKKLDRAESTLREVTADLAETKAAVAQERAQASGMRIRELAKQRHVPEEALVAFVETVGELLGTSRELSVPAARRAAIVAAASEAWENELGPMLSSAQVRELLGDVSRQRVDELLRNRRLIGLRDSAGRRQFPAFQFADGRPLQTIIDAYWVIADAAIDDWTAAAWCVAPDEALDALTPIQWARETRDPERLAVVARQDAARLAR